MVSVASLVACGSCVCGGAAVWIRCGICALPGLPGADSSDNCVPDCNGVWGGKALEDQCGVCDDDIMNNCELACQGNPCGDGACLPVGGGNYESLIHYYSVGARRCYCI